MMGWGSQRSSASEPAGPVGVSALSTDAEPGPDARMVRVPVGIVDQQLPEVQDWLRDRIDACAIDRDADGSRKAVIQISPADLQTLQMLGVPVEDAGSLADHIAAFAPWNTLAKKRVPSIEAVVGQVFTDPAGGSPRGPGIDCQAIGTSLQPYSEFHDIDEGICFMQNLAAAYPDIVRMISIGQSLEGREIWALKITDNPDAVEADEERILFTGVHHAREWATHEVMLYLAEYLTGRYATDARVQNIVNNSVVWLVPVVNPDGFAYTWNTGIPNARMWRKNRRINSGSSCLGVDINRNYGYKWGFDTAGSSANKCSETYRGASAASEPETQAIQALVAQEKFTVAVSYHSYSQLFLFAWGYTNSITSESFTAQRALGDRCASEIFNTHGKVYAHGQSSYTIYRTNGDFNDYAYGAHGVFGFTPEVRPRLSSEGGFLLPEDQILPCAEENAAAALWLMDNVADATVVSRVGGSGLFEEAALGSRVPFSWPAPPVHQRPDDLLGYPAGFFTNLQTILDDAAHNPSVWGGYSRDYEACGSGSGYEIDIGSSTALRDWVNSQSSYKALPYVYEGGADIMLSNVQPESVNIIGIPSTVPVDLANVRIIKRIIVAESADFGVTENVLEERTALQDLASPSPWIDWNWQYIDTHGGSHFSHPLGLNGADTHVQPFRAYRVGTHVASYFFNGTTAANAVYLLRFPASSVDCNRNGVFDALDIASSGSMDCNGDGVPDECQLDCNHNGLHDSCDPEATDMALFVAELISQIQNPDYVCLFDLNEDGLLDGGDVAGFVKRLVEP